MVKMAAAAPMTVRDLMKKLRRRGAMSNIPDSLQQDEPLVKFIIKSRELLLVLQRLCGNVVVICQKNKQCVGRILFDGRHIKLHNKGQQIVYIVLNKEGVCIKTNKGDLIGNHNGRRCLPKNIKLSRVVKPLDLQTVLSSLLPFSLFHTPLLPPPPPPTNRDETLTWLRFYKIIQYVVIRWCYYMHPITSRPETVYWIYQHDLDYEELNTQDVNKQVVIVDAFTGADGKLSFRETYKKHKLFKYEEKVKDNMSNDYLMQVDKLAIPELPPPPDFKANENNRSSSFSLTLTGLSQAYRLGAIKSKSTLTYLSQQMAEHIPRVWFHLDSEDNICHACYCSGSGDDYTSFEIQQPSNDNFASWKLFFDHVWIKCADLRVWREQLLMGVVHNLDNEDSHGTRFKCHQSLLQAINKITIHTYAGNDKVMHALKIAFAHYVYAIKGNRGNIKMETNNLHGIVCLVSRDISIENIAPLLLIAPQKESDIDKALWEVACQWITNDGYLSPLSPPLSNPNVNAKRHWTNMSDNTIKLSPFKPKSLDIYIERRSIQLLDMVKLTFCAIAKYLCDAYCLDITSMSYTSMASISIKIIQLSFYDKGGPMSQSIEKTKIQYANKIRLHSRGGFSYSIGNSIMCGQSLFDNTNATMATGIAEYDVTSCYGYSACNMRAPAGFCIGYTTDPSGNYLLRTDKQNRANTFEYRACMSLLHKMSKSETLSNIRSVYSNFSPLGLFYIGKHPIDLVIILDNETQDTLIIQFDGQFAHGCSECPPLNRYVNDALLSEVIERTQRRNNAITDWIATSKGNQRFHYTIYTDCHHPEFTSAFLSKAFAQVPELRKYTEPYRQLPQPGMIMTVDHILNAQPDLTYLLVGSGYIPTNKRTTGGDGPLLIWKQSSNGKWVQEFGWDVIVPMLFTRDTLEFAVHNYGFQLTSIESCYFYRTCDIYPQVYQHLITERYKTTCPALATFIKTIVNYSVGIMGYNQAKQTMYGKPKISNKIMKFDSDSRAVCTPIGTISNKAYWLRQLYKTQEQINASKYHITNNALPVFSSIVEYGKLRMQEIAAFWHKHTSPGTIRICYSQVDNFIIAMSAATLDETINPELMTSYLEQRPYFIGNRPGQLKLVWNKSGPSWRFTTPTICNYACDDGIDNNEQEGKWKMSSVTDIASVGEAYNLLTQLGNGQNAQMIQNRRTNKLLDTHTKSTIHHFKSTRL